MDSDVFPFYYDDVYLVFYRIQAEYKALHSCLFIMFPQKFFIFVDEVYHVGSYVSMVTG